MNSMLTPRTPAYGERDRRDLSNSIVAAPDAVLENDTLSDAVVRTSDDDGSPTVPPPEAPRPPNNIQPTSECEALAILIARLIIPALVDRFLAHNGIEASPEKRPATMQEYPPLP